MKLSAKNVWVIPVLLAVLVALTGWWCNTEVRRAIEQQLSDELTAMIGADVTALEIWIDNQLRLVQTLASEDKVNEMALAVMARVQKDGLTQEFLSEFEEVRKLGDYIRPRLRAERLGFVVLDPDGVFVAAPFEVMLGDQLHDEAREKLKPVFTAGVPVLLTPYQPPRPERGEDRMGGRGGPGKGGGPRGFLRDEERGESGDPMRPGQRQARSGEADGGFTGPGRQRGGGGPRGDGQRREGGVGPSGGNGQPPGPGRSGGPRGRGRRNRTIMAVAAPLKNSAGEVVAAIGLMIQPDQEFTRILSVARSGETGETFAFDGNGIMLSQSRFENQLRKLDLIEERSGSALNLELRDPGVDLTVANNVVSDAASRPLIKLVQEAVSGNNGVDVTGTRDYRGIPVVGAWRWLPRYEFGVATKLDAAEAFTALRVLRLVFLILLLLSVLSGVGLFLFSYLNVILRRQMEDAALEAKELGQYTLEEKIGEGGMGSVYRARHALLRRDTAVKLLLPDKADEYSIKRFEREVQMTCRLAHPNTIQIFDYGHTPDGIFYYAMEYLDGVNLRDLVQVEGRLSEGRVMHLIRQVCASLSEAHDAGLVHRDIKPANVIVSDRGGVPDMVKVLDFGLVKSYRQDDMSAVEATQTCSITGTPQFIAPESVARPDEVDHRSDLYAVGALAYYLLLGEHVFTGGNAFELMQKHVAAVPEPLHVRLGRSVDPTFEAIVMSCLEKDPARRPQSARALIDAMKKSALWESWSSSEQAAWWRAYRSRKSGLVEVGGHTGRTVDQPTLRIDLEDRTRVVS